MRPVPPDRYFRLRDLYIGMEGAKAWIALTNDVSEWPSPRHEQDLFDVTVDMVRGLHVRTLISLGPGSAEKDKELAINLRPRFK